MRIIPLFPLNVVLFPGMVLPLRIFEPRYRLMFRRCLDTDKQFGIALIKDGEEVGSAATPHMTGTLAEISGYEVMPDGQIMLVCVGLRRFQILKQVPGEPYLQAEIEILPEGEPDDPIDEHLVSAAKDTLEKYLAALSTLTNMSVQIPGEQLSPIDLSYLIAATLQIDNQQKQALLTASGTEERLRMALDLLNDENSQITAYIEKSRKRGDFFFRGYRGSVN